MTKTSENWSLVCSFLFCLVIVHKLNFTVSMESSLLVIQHYLQKVLQGSFHISDVGPVWILSAESADAPCVPRWE